MYFPISPGGGIGRRTGLKIPRWRQRAGSIPAPGTKSFLNILRNLQSHTVTFKLQIA